jgi:ABC-2 type transport system permease protein
MMRLFPAGSVPWLLAHEMRLGWRGMGSRPRNGTTKPTGSIGKVVLWLLAAIGIGAVVLGGVGLGFLAGRFPLPRTEMVTLILTGGGLVLLTLLLSQTINMSVQALYERRDLDLLLSSPLKPRVVLTVRAIAIALVTGVLYIGIVTPFIVTATLLGRPEWLGLYGLLAGMTLLAAALGMVLTLALFAAIGPRKTRTVAQILGGLVGGAVFLASQAYNFTRGDEGETTALTSAYQNALAGGAFQPDGWLGWPLRAVTGDPVAVVAVLLAGLIPFVLTIAALGPYFASAAAGAASGESGPKGKAVRGPDKDFADGLQGAMVRKELRLLARDPQLISQILLRLLYLLPLGFVLYRNADSLGGIAFGAGAVVIMAGQLAGSFSWITISAEDAPDLLAAAPIDRTAADRAKLTAALIPTLALTALALAGIAWLAPLAAIVVFAGCVASAVSSGLINLWQQAPANRKAFNQQKRGNWFVGLAEFLVQALWAAATGMAVAGWTWGGAAAVVAVLITLMLRRSPERRYAAAQ